MNTIRTYSWFHYVGSHTLGLFGVLPFEIADIIFLSCDLPSLLCLGDVCKLLRAALKHDKYLDKVSPSLLICFDSQWCNRDSIMFSYRPL